MTTRVRTTHESECPDIGPICAVRDEPPQIHDQRFAVSELRAIVEHAFTDALGVEVTELPMTPWRVLGALSFRAEGRRPGVEESPSSR